MSDDGGKGRILIVDDGLENIQVLGGVLKREGYQINVARSGLQALESVATMAPDLILLDIIMPELDGRDTCRRLKANPTTKDIPVIFLTAKTKAEEIVDGFELGAVDYITKPFSVPELMARVNTHLELKLSRDMIAKQNDERKELLHVLCHDLTNPLGAIRIYLQWAERKPEVLSKKRLDMLCAVENGLQVIDLVRQMRALEEDKIKLKLEPVSIRSAIDACYSMMEPKFAEKQIELVTGFDDSLVVLAERTSFVNSVLNNLLTNAIKFSFSGSSITVEAYQETEQVILTIEDRGIGMPETLLADVFDISKATSRKGTNGEQGTGFGMPLLRKFVTAYGGTVELSSTEKTQSSDNHGTQARLTLSAG